MDTPTTPEKKPITPAETLPPGTKPKRNPLCCPWFYVILLACAIIVGAFLYSDYRAAHTKPGLDTNLTDLPQIDSQAASINGNIEILQNENSSETDTTTPTSSAALYGGQKSAAFGSTIRLFKGESVLFNSEGQTEKIRVTAVGFTDSRCPADAVCIWEGERGVELDVVSEGTGDSAMKLSLKLKTNSSQAAKGHTFNLLTVDDEKGGTYAEIKVD